MLRVIMLNVVMLSVIKLNVVAPSSNLGSLEEFVENLVKRWEMEASHKIDFHQWRTVDHEKYCLQVDNY